jgi:hypothetical protein
LSSLYQDSIESLDYFWDIAGTRSFSISAAQKSVDALKQIREDVNKVFLIELAYQLEAPRDFLTGNEMICFVYCYCRSSYLRTLIKLCYKERVLKVLDNWSGILNGIKQGVDLCLGKLSHGQYEASREPSFEQFTGMNISFSPDEFINERVAVKLLKNGYLNEAFDAIGFSVWDRYAYCLRLKYDFVREDIFPYLYKKSVLGGYGYNDTHLAALLYFSNDSSFLVEGVTFTQAINTIHNNTSPTLRSYNFLLAGLNNAIATLREELNLPAVAKTQSSAIELREFCGVSVSYKEILELKDLLVKKWQEKREFKEERTLAVFLDEMC